MSRRLKKIFGVGLPVVVSAILVYFIVRDVEKPQRIWEAFGRASWPLLAAIVPLNLLSHFLRAQRWRRFIGRPVSLYFAFSSTMIGYAVNGVVPRGGEIARVVNMHRTTGVAVARILATLVAERVFDLLVLLMLIGGSLWLEGAVVAGRFPWLSAVAPVALAGALFGFVVLIAIAVKGERLALVLETVLMRAHPKAAEIAPRLIRQASAGLAFVKHSRQVGLVAVETVLIWGLYIATFCLGLAAFGVFEQTGLRGGVVAYSITSASALVPSAGQIGTFHKLGVDSLTGLYGVAAVDALAFVTALHLLLFYFVAGGAGIALWIGQAFVARSRRESMPPARGDIGKEVSEESAEGEPVAG